MLKFYQLNNTILEHVDSATYLGILLHKSMKFSDHISAVSNKCNRKLGFLKRTLKGCPQSLKQTAYFSLVRSSAEYAGAIWDPYRSKDKDQLQKIQNRAVRWVRGIGPRQQVSVSEIAKELKWPTLERRRKDQRLTLFFKILNVQHNHTHKIYKISHTHY